jgi:hypothetical protein
MKTIWNVVKRETGKVQLSCEIASININNTEIKDSQLIANEFSTYFVRVAEDTALTDEDNNSSSVYQEKSILK